jgi:hypothetical protein
MVTAPGYRMLVTAFWRRITDYGMPATDDRLPNAGYGMSGDGHAGYGVPQPTVGHDMRSTDTGYGMPAGAVEQRDAADKRRGWARFART